MTQVEVGRGLDPRALRLVNGTIHEKIGQPISVEMLSSVAGLSRSYFPMCSARVSAVRRTRTSSAPESNTRCGG
jgi:hypothetical protein